jgi:hypothetical protein
MSRLAHDVLPDRDGALPDERERHRMGADAVARDAAGGVGGVEEGEGRQMKQQIVEGGCTQRPFGFGSKSPWRTPTKPDAERPVARVDRFIHWAGRPWRALRRVLREACPG